MKMVFHILQIGFHRGWFDGNAAVLVREIHKASEVTSILHFRKVLNHSEQCKSHTKKESITITYTCIFCVP